MRERQSEEYALVCEQDKFEINFNKKLPTCEALPEGSSSREGDPNASEPQQHILKHTSTHHMTHNILSFKIHSHINGIISIIYVHTVY